VTFVQGTPYARSSSERQKRDEKNVSFADGVALSVQRFDDRWIRATAGGVSYEFDRGSMNLTFAGTIMKASTATIINWGR
jgi:hypothetical protein